MSSLVKLTRNYPSLLDHFFENDYSSLPARSTFAKPTMPSVNIKNGQDAFEIDVAAPGMKKEDFKIELEHDVLTISSEVEVDETTTDEDECYTCREFSYQSFSRSFTLPKIANTDKIDAKYVDGILKVYIPKKDEAKARLSKLIKIK